MEIRDTPFAAFEAVIRYIYTDDETDICDIDDLDLLFRIYCLSDKYFLEDLKILVSKVIKTFFISCHNYAAVFRTTEAYKHLLGMEKLCGDLWDRCVRTVKEEWKTVADSVLFWSKNHDDDVAIKQALVKRMAELSHSADKCTCGYSKLFCCYGDPLTLENCREGLAVKPAAKISCYDFNGRYKSVETFERGIVQKYSKCEEIPDIPICPIYSENENVGVLKILWTVLREDKYDIRIHDSYTNILVDSHYN